VPEVTATVYTFRLVSSCGETLGSIMSVDPCFEPGDTVVLEGVGYWVRSVISLGRMAEFVDAPANGLLEVEPI
jgi:hypothetical protein